MIAYPLLAAIQAVATLCILVVPAAAADPLDADRGLHRVLLVSAARADEPLLRRQRQVFAAMRAGAAARDLVLVAAVGDGPRAAALRRRFDLDPTAFQVVLIGKDGGAKQRAATVLGPEDLFPTIDAMPMRQDEMRQDGMRRYPVGAPLSTAQPRAGNRCPSLRQAQRRVISPVANRPPTR